MMDECCTNYFEMLGKDGMKGSSLASIEGDTVHFMVTNKKQPNYKKYCENFKIVEDPVSTINLYTDHTTKYFAKVNLSLASDSDTIETYGDYISQLKGSICSTPLYDAGIVFRGVNLSTRELAEMEKLKNFFIPSFTSCSVEQNLAYAKSAMMCINLPYGSHRSCTITENLSKFHSEEREVLISCYSAFRLHRVEMENGIRILSLYLDEYLSCLDYTQV